MRIINEKTDLLKLVPGLESLITSDTMTGKSGDIYQVQGTSTINNLAVIANLMYEMKANKTLEIGMAYGASTLVFGAMHSKLNLPLSEHIAIDPFQLTHYGNCGVINLEKANLDKFLKMYYETSCLVLPQLLSQNKKYDLIYIDGSHIFEDAFLDTYFTMRLLRSGGIMLLDDSSDPHISKIISFIRSNLRTGITEIDLTSYRLPSQNSLKYYLAKQLQRVQLTGFRITGKIERACGTPLLKF